MSDALVLDLPAAESPADVAADSKTRWSPDVWVCSSTALIVGLGILLVYSASSVYAARIFRDAEHFLALHVVRTVLGVGCLIVATRIPSRWLLQRCGWLFTGSVILCVLVLIPGIGHMAGGARRWVNLGPLNVQPSELAKLSLVIMISAYLARRLAQSAKDRTGLGPALLVAQLPAVLVLVEPDLGTAVVIELLCVMLVAVAGLRLRYLVFLGLLALPIGYTLIVATPFRLRRLLAYIDPFAYRSTIGYQVTEALISIGSGGVTGVGLGEGKHKMFFLPEAHTDFIFAILGEELGLVGIVVLLGAFAVLVWRGAKIALSARTDFDRFLAFGITVLIGIPVVFNTCVATGLLPTPGLTLPLVSYGGSNVVTTLGAIGMLLRIDRDTQLGLDTQDESSSRARSRHRTPRERGT